MHQRRGVPGFTVRRVQDGETALDVLRSAGITAGTPGPVAAEPDRNDVRPGTVQVFGPGPGPSYRPSPEEVQLAAAYVACGRSTRFPARLDAASTAVLRDLELRYADDAADLYAALTSARSRISR